MSKSKQYQSAVTAVSTALSAIRDEIARHEEGRGEVSSIRQLTSFQDVLTSVAQRLEAGDVPPRGGRYLGITRVVNDSWPLDSHLGELIARAEHRYRDLDST